MSSARGPDGNPRAWVSDHPAGLEAEAEIDALTSELSRAVISRRLERLNENEKRALAAAAVIGAQFQLSILLGNYGTCLGD